MKSGTPVWIPVAELIANPLPQNPDITFNSPNERPDTVGADEMTRKTRRSFLVVAFVVVVAVTVILLWVLSDPLKVGGCHSISVDGSEVDVPPGAISFDIAKGPSSYKIELTYDAEGCIETAKATKLKK